MGVVLDSSVLIGVERARTPLSQTLAAIRQDGSTKFLISSMTVVELEHGWHRANTEELALSRRTFLDELYKVIPVEPFTVEMAVLAAKVESDARKVGQIIPTADLIIGVTALRLGYSVGTRNPRHFKMIEGLIILANTFQG